MVFVDFEKAFDSINWGMLWKILRHYGIPSKVMRMIQVLYDCFQARVLHDGRMTEPFEMKTGATGMPSQPTSLSSSTRLVNQASVW